MQPIAVKDNRPADRIDDDVVFSETNLNAIQFKLYSHHSDNLPPEFC